MKNPYTYKAFYLLTLLAVLSCNKEPCKYETENIPQVNGCVDSPSSGYMVVTLAGDQNTSAMILNTNPTYNAPFGLDWLDFGLGSTKLNRIATPQWNKATIGTVFGIALDEANGIYLSASNIYAENGFFPGTVGATGGSAGIYYTNFLSPTVTTTLLTTIVSANANTVGTSTIPNTGLGLNSIGNIAFDKVNKQLFATNLEDGRIYRINPMTGIVLSIFDPFILDNGLTGIAPAAEQLWGIGVFTSGGVTSIYFAKSYNNKSKEIWSIPLDSSGEFVANQIGSTKLFDDASLSSKLEIAYFSDKDCKITDIAFSTTGRLLVAERGHAHKSRVFEFVKIGLTWGSGNNFYVGGTAINSGQNCAGGVDYGNRQTSATAKICDDIVWASGNYMPFSIAGKFIYGLEGISAAGNSATVVNNQTSDLYIDYNNSYNIDDKGGIGDVEIFDSECSCN